MARSPRTLAALAAAFAACVPAASEKFSCQEDADCSKGFTCRSGGCEPTGSIGAACRTKADCPAGQECGADEACVAADPCLTANGGCDPAATCTNASGVAACECGPGFVGDGRSCRKVDCTESNGGCDAHASCLDDAGTISCACLAGYEGDGKTCTPSSCARNNGGCAPGATCAGEDGATTCTCPAELEGDGRACDCRWRSKEAGCTPLPALPGLLAHYSARVASSVVRGENGRVSTWRDLGPSGRDLFGGDLSPAFVESAINDLPGLDFADGTGLLSQTFPLRRTASVFVVAKWGTPASSGTLVHHGHRDTDWSIEASEAADGQVHFQTDGDGVSTLVPVETGTTYLFAASLGRARRFAAISDGGTKVASGNGSSQLVEGDANLYVGRSDVGQASNATIGEIVYFDRVLSAEERTQVVRYLSRAWGITPCGASLQDNDLDGVCQPDCSTMDTSACDPNAACSDLTGQAACTCNEGFFGSGALCSRCDACSGRGECNDGPNGDGRCLCEQGWAGAECTECAPDYRLRGDDCVTGQSRMYGGANAHELVKGMVATAEGVTLLGTFQGDTTMFGETTFAGRSGVSQFLMGLDPAGNQRWHSLITADRRQDLRALVQDVSGNLYAAGYMEAPLDLAAGSGRTSVKQGAVVMGTTPAGDLRWASSTQGEFVSLTVDPSGNVTAVGYANGSNIPGAVKVNGTTVPNSVDLTTGEVQFVNGKGGADTLIMNYSSQGIVRWGRVTGGVSLYHGEQGETFRAVASDAQGNVYAAGAIANPTDFGAGQLTPPGSGSNSAPTIVSYDARGTLRWTKMFSPLDTNREGAGFATSVAVSPNGDVAVFGLFKGDFDFGAGTVTQEIAPYSQMASMLLVLDGATGEVKHSRVLQKGVPISANSMSIDGSGDIYIAGNINNGGADLGGGAVGSGAFWARFSPSLEFVEAHTSRSGAYPTAFALIARPDGGSILAGHHAGCVDFGFGNLCPSGLTDIFVSWFP